MPDSKVQTDENRSIASRLNRGDLKPSCRQNGKKGVRWKQRSSSGRGEIPEESTPRRVKFRFAPCVRIGNTSSRGETSEVALRKEKTTREAGAGDGGQPDVRCKTLKAGSAREARASRASGQATDSV